MSMDSSTIEAEVVGPDRISRALRTMEAFHNRLSEVVIVSSTNVIFFSFVCKPITMRSCGLFDELNPGCHPLLFHLSVRHHQSWPRLHVVLFQIQGTLLAARISHFHIDTSDLCVAER